MEQVLRIAEFILNSFAHIWIYLLLTLPLSVAINLSGFSSKIKMVFSYNPVLSVFLATAIGAFSPFCSCGVIPVITSLLTGGVPLAPVMSFWIASPSMDPEIFFLSIPVLGLKLSVWRLASTFVISLTAGYLTHIASIKGFLGTDVLRTSEKSVPAGFLQPVRELFQRLTGRIKRSVVLLPVTSGQCNTKAVCCIAGVPGQDRQQPEEDESCAKRLKDSSTCCEAEPEFGKRLLKETVRSLSTVVKFMGLAFFLTALIEFYFPEKIITGFLAREGSGTLFLAALAGIPAYTTNITALPLVGSLLEPGMNKGAALTFLIAGSATTLPAMAAVWGIAKPKVFALYVIFIFTGSLLAGYLFNLFA